jgi:DNA-binding NtrC family response regulator
LLPILNHPYYGETGTGKGLVAKLLHYNGVRADKPFLELNCAAIRNTSESEHLAMKQAHLRTQKMKKVFLKRHIEAIIFLDEIGDMSQTLQAKLAK